MGAEPCAGVEGEPRRTASEIPDGRRDVSRLVGVGGMPNLFPVERTAIRQVLVRHSPASVAALHDVHPPRLVAAIRVVVAGEQVAEVVERQLLRISQPVREDLEIRTVGVAAEHRAALRVFPSAAIGEHVVAAIAQAEIDLAIRSRDQAMQVVSAKRVSHPVAVVERRAFLGDAIAIGVPQFPQIGDAGVVDRTAVKQHAGAGAVADAIELFREHRRHVRLPVPIAIDKQSQSIVMTREVGRFLFQVFLHVGDAIVHRFGRQVVIQPIAASPVVFNAFRLPEGLADENASLRIDAKGDGVGEHRFGGEQLPLPTGRQLETGERLLPLIGRRRDRRLFWRSRRFDRVNTGPSVPRTARAELSGCE